LILQWFETLNETLEELIRRYPHASADEKKHLDEQWNVLKSLSDEMIEAWLQFEDKMAAYREMKEDAAAQSKPEAVCEPFVKGQGYFKLQMYEKGARCFEETLVLRPDMLVARVLLAMCRMYLRDFAEAQRHFQMIAALSDDPKLRAIAYNALGCVQAVYANMRQAQHYFAKAVEADPSFDEPRRNLETCKSHTGQLQLQLGCGELQALV
jgi:tetratricopeptide (TPR) repeat protein